MNACMQALEQYLQGRRKQVTRYTSFMFLPHTEQLQLVSESELEHVLEPMNGEVCMTLHVYINQGLIELPIAL